MTLTVICSNDKISIKKCRKKWKIMGEIKQTNFRVDQETADTFRKFCEENKMNQAQGFDHIMQVVEMDHAKTAVPGRATEIETFEKAIKDIMGAYLTSIEINDNAEARIREQFASALDRKDKTIDELREKVQQLQAVIDEAESRKNAAEKDRAMVKEHEATIVQQLEAAQKNSADLERINSMFSAQLAEMTSKLDGYDALKASEADLVTKVTELEKQISDQKTATKNEIQQLKIQAELDKERAIMTKERELYDQIRQVDKENAKLSAKIEQLLNDNNNGKEKEKDKDKKVRNTPRT